MPQRCLLERRETPITSPFDETALPAVVKALDAVQYPGYPQNGSQFISNEQTILERLGLWKNNQEPPHAYKSVGQALYQGLGPEGQGALAAVRNYTIADRSPTNYVLRFPAGRSTRRSNAS